MTRRGSRLRRLDGRFLDSPLSRVTPAGIAYRLGRRDGARRRTWPYLLGGLFALLYAESRERAARERAPH